MHREAEQDPLVYALISIHPLARFGSTQRSAETAGIEDSLAIRTFTLLQVFANTSCIACDIM